MSYLTNQQVIAWGQFYLRLGAVTAWNSTRRWLYGLSGAATAQAATVVDFRDLGWSALGWTWLGTYIVSLALAYWSYPLPEPTPPTPPTVDVTTTVTTTPSLSA